MTEREIISDLLGRSLSLAQPVVDTACKLINDLLGQPFQVAGGLLGDQIYTWRWANRVRIAYRAKKMMDKDGIPAAVLPPGFLIPLIDSAEDVEDPDLQELWARLIASGASDASHRHPAFVVLLRQLARDEAMLLALVRSSTPRFEMERDLDRDRDVWCNHRIIRNEVAVDRLQYPERFLFDAYHLQALGLLVVGRTNEEPRYQEDTGAKVQTGLTSSYVLETTEFGKQFVQACIPADVESRERRTSLEIERASASSTLILRVSCQSFSDHSRETCETRY